MMEGSKGFAAGYDWLDGFKRQRLSLRTRGAQGQQPPENLQVIAEAFALEVAEMATKLGVKEIWNADETAVFFELIPRKTIDITGTKTVWVRCAGAEKRRVSVLLLGSSCGRKKPPFVVMKERHPGFLSSRKGTKSSGTASGSGSGQTSATVNSATLSLRTRRGG